MTGVVHPHLVAAVVCGVLGLVTGSFAGVLADRVPKGQSIVSPPSHCDSCEAPIRPSDNIPLLSYLLLRGRCRNCGAGIPARVLGLEVVTAGLFALVAWRIPSFWALPSYLVVVTGLVALSTIDFEHKRLPSPIIYGTFLVATPLLVLASGMTGDWNALAVAGLSALACFVFFLLIFLAAPRGMGFGDVRLSALCGGWLGWLGASAVPVGIVAGFVLAGLPAIVLLAGGKATRKTKLAFGPFLAGGTMVGILFGRLIAHAWAHI